MRWSKLRRKVPGDKRLRCTTKVRRRTEVACGRRARAYMVSKYGGELGQQALCPGHARFLAKENFTLTLIDRRKKTA